MRRIATFVLVIFNFGLVALLGTQISHAHPAADYVRPWPTNHNEPYYFDDDVPAGLGRDYIQLGLDEWSNRDSGRGPNFVRSGELDRVLDYAHLCAGTNSIVYVRGDFEVTNGGYAGTAICGGTPMSQFVMIFEETPSTGPWHVGSTNPPAGSWDLQSIATHESGHAAGFDGGPNNYGHFSEGDAACVDANEYRSTMCPGRSTDRGTRWMRSLTDAHDLHTLQDRY